MIDAEAAARELSAGHTATREAVLACVDVEAGLREVLLASEHDAMRADLTAELQVESGLAAIVDPDARQKTAPAFVIRGGGPVAKMVQNLPAEQRLTLRTHPSVSQRAVLTAALTLSSRALAANLGNLVILPNLRDLWRVLTRARDRAWHGDFDRGADLIQALTYAHALTNALARVLKQAREFAARLPAGEERAFAQEIALEIDSAKENTVTFVRKLTLARDAVQGANDLPVSEELFSTLLAQAQDCDPERARSLADDLDWNLTFAIDQALFEDREGGDKKASRSSTDLSRALTEAWHQTPTTDRAGTLVWLRDALDSFQGADLREANLTGVPLEGLRWSESTQWPDDWADKIRKHSVPVPGEEGIFVVRGYGTLASDSLALRQLLSVNWPTC